MSYCAIEPFCHGVEGQMLTHLCRIGLHCAYELGLFQSHVRRPQHQLQRQGSKLLKCYEQTAQCKAAAQERAPLGIADPQASCTHFCLEAPRAPVPALPCFPQMVTRQHRTGLPALGWRHPSLLLLLEGRECDFGRGWEEGGINEGDLNMPYP